MPKKVTPKQLFDRAIKELKESGDPLRAEHNRSYFKKDEVIHSYGQDAPTMRRLAADFFQEVRGDWGIGEALEFCERMIADRFIESRLVGMMVLANYRRQFDTVIFKRAEKWLADDRCDNWALTDGLCSMILMPMVLKDAKIVSKLRSWTVKRNLWLRRASAVALTAAARRGLYLDDAYWIAGELMKYPEDLIHKANGWMLRDAGKTDPSRLEIFLMEHRPRMPRTTLRYAIEKFPESKRREILGRKKITKQTK